jgi:hypothetical protein
MYTCNICFLILPIMVMSSSRSPAIILIDSFSHSLSGYVKEYCHEKDVHVIEAVSPYTFNMLRSKGANVPEDFRVPSPGLESSWIEHHLPDEYYLTACISESDAGVPSAERLSEGLQLVSNGLSEHLRNKYIMNLRLKEAGLQTSLQYLATDWESLKTYLEGNPKISENKNGFRVVVKPYRGVASDGVSLCRSIEEVKVAFSALLNTPKYGGGKLDKVLVQEFLEGDEYAIDTVSSQGEIKILAVWKYRKMPKNNAPFVYQVSELVDAVDEHGNLLEVCDYCLKALEALNVIWGPTHTEIKMTTDGPMMIEVNARWHAQDFCPITRRCLGYDALVSTIDAYIFPTEFAQIPLFPVARKKYGMIIHLISVVQGKIISIHHIDVIKSLPSYLSIELSYEINDDIVLTTDIRTDSGYVLLYNENDDILQLDYEKVCALQYTMFEVLEDISQSSTSSESSASLIN